MLVEKFFKHIGNLNITNIVGVPDSLLKSFCDYLQQDDGANYKHYVGANEGACVGLATGFYLATKRPACVYLQNSGIGNMVNPIASLIHSDVYRIPMLYVIGWRGEPGVSDEPQHIFQGKITTTLLDNLDVTYAIVNQNTADKELALVFQEAANVLSSNKPFAIIIRKDTFDKFHSANNQNTYSLNREDAIKLAIKQFEKDAIIVSTTGKISRELYECSDKILGNHEQSFLTVGSMGHASMIALGLALEKVTKRVYCFDGDGAALMHLGSFASIAQQLPKNLVHIVLNNHAHESVGGMHTCNDNVSFSNIATALNYPFTYCVDNEKDLVQAIESAKSNNQLTLIEIFVKNGARADLGRPKESPQQNKEAFMRYHAQKGE